MNRRTFLQRCASGLVATAALASIPASLIKAAPRLAEPARFWACELMRKVYNAHVIGRGSQYAPEALIVGRDLAECFEGEILPYWRYVSTDAALQPFEPALRFKGATVLIEGRGYACRVGTKAEWLEYQRKAAA